MFIITYSYRDLEFDLSKERHMTFRSINRWTFIGRMVISNVRDNCISRHDFILHCEIKYRRTEYGSSLGICCQI
jgi:hypothetical protein